EDLAATGIPAGPVLDVDRALAHPQLRARGMIAPIEHPKAGPLQLLGVPVRLSETPGRVSSPPPVLGEHTREVLRNELQMSDAEIDELAKSGAIGLRSDKP